MDSHLASTQLGTIALFCRAAELGSFSRAADEFGLTPAAVSRGIARLEERLGVLLFQRTTRKVTLTEDGELYFEECRQAVAQIEHAEQALGAAAGAATGSLRLGAPPSYAWTRLPALLAAFVAGHPAIGVEIALAGDGADPGSTGCDVLIQDTRLADPRLPCRPIETLSCGIFAAPAYLARHGSPASPDDLARHECIVASPPDGPGGPRTPTWPLRAGNREVELPVAGRLRCVDDGYGPVMLARAGTGLACAHHVVAAPWLASGELVEVLQPYTGREVTYAAVYPRRSTASPAVRAFVGFIAAAAIGPAPRTTA